MKEFLLGVIATLVFVLVLQWLRLKIWAKNKFQISEAIREKILGDRRETKSDSLANNIAKFNKRIKRKG